MEINQVIGILYLTSGILFFVSAKRTKKALHLILGCTFTVLSIFYLIKS